MNKTMVTKEAFEIMKSKAYKKGYKQGRADALSIDMDKPMHFTDEQKAWIKNYIIINAERQRADAIDEYKLKLLNAQSDLVTDIHKAKVWVEFKRQASDISEQLKEHTKKKEI